MCSHPCQRYLTRAALFISKYWEFCILYWGPHIKKFWGDAIKFQHYRIIIIINVSSRNVKFYTCCDEPYLDITFNITMRRKTLFYTVFITTSTRFYLWFIDQQHQKIDIFITFSLVIIIISILVIIITFSLVIITTTTRWTWSSPAWASPSSQFLSSTCPQTAGKRWPKHSWNNLEYVFWQCLSFRWQQVWNWW